MALDEKVKQRARRIKLLLMDCDGVLTDGRLYFDTAGEALKVFNVHDGQGIVDWHRTGSRSGIISGRNSPIVELRAKQLGITFVEQGQSDKAEALIRILSAAAVDAADAAYIGDDTPDLCVFEKVGFAVAVNDAVDPVNERAHFITQKKGGKGAVREVIDLIFRCKAEA